MTIIVDVSVVPNSKHFAIVAKDEKVKIYLRNAPENNKANIELIKELGNALDCPIRIISGFSSKRKKLELGISESDWRIFFSIRK